MRAGRIVLLVIGSFVTVIGLALLASSVALAVLVLVVRDDDGYFTSATERFATDTAAITSRGVDLELGPGDGWWGDEDLATVRIRMTAPSETALFVGIAEEADVEAYLDDVPHDEVVDVRSDPFVAVYRREHARGTAEPLPPEGEDFWAAQAAGTGSQTIEWNLRSGTWAVVVMRDDAGPGVLADVQVGVRIDVLGPIAVGLLVAGVLVTGGGTVMVVAGALGLRRPPRIPPPGRPGGPPVAAAPPPGVGAAAPPPGVGAPLPPPPLSRSAG